MRPRQTGLEDAAHLYRVRLVTRLSRRAGATTNLTRESLHAIANTTWDETTVWALGLAPTE